MYGLACVYIPVRFHPYKLMAALCMCAACCAVPAAALAPGFIVLFAFLAIIAVIAAVIAVSEQDCWCNMPDVER